LFSACATLVVSILPIECRLTPLASVIVMLLRIGRIACSGFLRIVAVRQLGTMGVPTSNGRSGRGPSRDLRSGGRDLL
jgi:hypothetical protein